MRTFSLEKQPGRMRAKLASGPPLEPREERTWGGRFGACVAEAGTDEVAQMPRWPCLGGRDEVSVVSGGEAGKQDKGP